LKQKTNASSERISEGRDEMSAYVEDKGDMVPAVNVDVNVNEKNDGTRVDVIEGEEDLDKVAKDA